MAPRKTTKAVETTDEAAPTEGTCNLPGCLFDAVTRGLCDAHWSTHRGLADPEDVAPATPEEARP